MNFLAFLDIIAIVMLYIFQEDNGNKQQLSLTLFKKGEYPMKQRSIYLILCIFIVFVIANPQITIGGLKDEIRRGGKSLNREAGRIINKIESQYNRTVKESKR